MKIAVLQYRLLHYRVELFELMKARLAKAGLDLVLVHGQASDTERLRKDEGELSWARRVRNRFLRIAGKDIVWQPLPPEARRAALVVTMQENRILSNYRLQLGRLVGGPRVAYWGHGKNFQSTAPGGLRERWKTFLLNKVDWWFAYTDLTVAHLEAQGYPSGRITNLENAIDVSGFQRELDSVSEGEIHAISEQFGLKSQSRVGLFCGSLYAEKKIGLLLESADLIRESVPDFHLVVIGDGPSAAEVQAAAESRPWIHCMGVRKGHDKAVLFRLAHVQLNPGLVGLHVLDAFAAGLPMVTTAAALHSPEIAYLRNGINGIITDNDDASSYARPLIDLLSDEGMRGKMAEQCRTDAQRYTVENMARNFCDGIIRCLDSYGLRPGVEPDSAKKALRE